MIKTIFTLLSNIGEWMEYWWILVEVRKYLRTPHCVWWFFLSGLSYGGVGKVPYCRTVKVMATRPYYIRATFPPLRHFSTKTFSQRHHCIHRLINHVYTQRPKSHSLSLPHDMVAAWIKHWDLRNINLGCVTRCQSIGSVERSHQGLPFHTPIATLPSCGTSVPVSGGHCIMVS